MQSLAELGFIVVQIDGMGTANRSKAFHDVAWKNPGDAGFPDRILWHRAVAAKYPYYDITRVGIYGTNVDPASTMQVVNALAKADNQFDLLVIPGANHGSGGAYGEKKRNDFFVHHLLGVEPSDWNTMPKKQNSQAAALPAQQQ